MYEKEEAKLHDMQKDLEKLSIPEDELTQAIQQGMQIAKSSERKKKRSFKRIAWSISIAALLFITLVTSIRVSPAFAKTVASIPGLERLVDLIQYDKGLQAIVDNEYYEAIGVSQTKDNIKVTIDGIIVDESGMVIFYTTESPTKLSSGDYGMIEIFHNGKSLEGSTEYGNPDQEDKKYRTDEITFTFGEQQKYSSKEFELKLNLRNEQKTSFSIPFTLKKDIQKGKVFTINKEIIMDGQKIIIEDITLYPLRVAVNMTFDQRNTMRILNFEDIRIEDERGEVWSSIRNGISSFGGSDDTNRTFFLQSNFFKQPKNLYLKFDKVQALPKKDAYIIVDLNKEKVIKGPYKDKLEITNISKLSIEAKMEGKHEDLPYQLFYGLKDFEGRELDTNSWSGWADNDSVHWQVGIEPQKIVNPVKVYFSAYPNYLKGSSSIQIK
ncbi:DUF4179 domain-containing protein [Viridibacillus arvi]|uniref:DUF4179 domain-containing protein n=1 Tax=Viridibacillus arvi TaxID=263475 RepID=UPI00187B6245|nr:DUF4179 domain-containing protein [Viridibacillus sp. JNUCC-6]QOV13187.1 DUF4179 domain-containing protein [Viridibacillus sp. JNUCC-6]